MTFTTQQKQSNQLSLFPSEMTAKLEGTQHTEIQTNDLTLNPKLLMYLTIKEINNNVTD